MRLPVLIPLDTRDGLTDQDGMLFNAVGELYEDKQFVETRPPLRLLSVEIGEAGGIVCYGGSIVVIYNDMLDGTFPLAAPDWAVGTTYSFQQPVWYNGSLYFSTSDSNVGNTPGVGTWWSSTIPTTPEWQSPIEYDIGDQVTYSGTTYYSFSNTNSGVTPGTNAMWSLTSPGTSRWILDGTPAGLPDGPQAASKQAAGDAWLAGPNPYKSCPNAINGYLTGPANEDSGQVFCTIVGCAGGGGGYSIGSYQQVA